MRIPKIYLETTIFNFYFADDSPDKKQDTLKLFDEIETGKYKPYTSDYVFVELRRATEPKQSQMLALIERYGVTLLEPSFEADRLAQIYVDEGIIPRRHFVDAAHIATATIHDLDFVVSYNFQHIVKRKTVMMTESVNLREGYKRIGVFSPTEVIENEE